MSLADIAALVDLMQGDPGNAAALAGAREVGRVGTVIYGLTTAVIAGCVVALAVTTVIG